MAEGSKFDRCDRPSSPLSLTLKILLAGVVAELVVMAVVWLLPPMSALATAILDAAMLGLLMVPILYFFILNPLIQSAKTRDDALRSAEQSKRDLAITLLSIGDAVISTDELGNIVRMNAVAETLTEWGQDEARGKPAADVFRMSSSAPENGSSAMISQVLNEGLARTTGGDEILITRSGKEVPISQNASPMRDSNGKICGAVLVFRDATKEREAARELIVRRDEAYAANQSKSALLADISHEVRTPLNCVIGLAELIEDHSTFEEARDRARMILRESVFMMDLVNGLLDNARAEAGKVDLFIRPVDLKKLLNALITHLSVVALRKNLYLEMNIEGDIPAFVLTDKTKIEQVLRNLVSNAIKFTETGGVTLGLKSTPGDQGTVLLLFSVQDTGPGIPKESQDAIFEPYVQLSEHQDGPQHGAGLGMSISKRLIEMMGGKAGVRSRVGEGATFLFELPVKPCSDSSHMRSLRLGTEKKAKVSCFPGAKILLAEDYPLNRDVVLAHLSDLEVEVVVAENGLQAVEHCTQQLFDLILMDVQMPFLDGLGASQKIVESCPHNNETAIVGLTAAVSDASVERCLEAGMIDVMTKPIRRVHFIAMVTAYLRAAGCTEQEVEAPVEAPSSVVESNAEEKVEGASTILDYPKALLEFGGNKRLLDDTLGRFIKTLDRQMVKISEAVEQTDFASVGRESHKIRGGSANLCAVHLTETAAALEKTVGNGDNDDAEILVSQLKLDVQQLREHVERMGSA